MSGSDPIFALLVTALVCGGCGGQGQEEKGRRPVDDAAADADAGLLPDSGGRGGDAGADAGPAAEDAGGDGDAEKPGPDAGADAAAPDGGPGPRPPFPRGLVATELLGQRHGGLLVGRAIIHLHALFSHDACDGHPVLPDGQPDEQCLQDLRDGLCADRVDFAMMTEHYGSMAHTLDFDRLFLQRAGDTWVDAGGRHDASAIHCPGGHTSLLMPGLEGGSGQVSPIGITGHPTDDTPGTPEAIEAAYRDDSPAGVQRMRQLGAVPVAIHLESQEPAWLAATDLDALEIGNLHTLIEPGYRRELGLDPLQAAIAFLSYFQQPDDHPPPDLVFLEFHQRLPLHHERWDALLALRMIAGFAGNDVHRNVLPAPLGDGERPDSYRRMMKWYVNHLLVTEKTPAQAREALARGRSYVVFEVLGSPAGFDFWAERADGGSIWTMGDVADCGGDAAAVHLRATRPRALLDGAGEEAAAEVPITLRLYRVTPAGSELVATTDGDLDLPAPGPGRYRVELEVTPTHLAPYLAGHEALLRPYPWVYSNPIEVR